ncbi:hypothetical protein [Nocardiopsis composta]|uniref:Uncharacterized protein n=1 Tax=Nocardiopsis composta TaxID=157465 RepID=A0A7W8VHJ0_9ACTN|nr:hypothetical protein [Nocardiopsis composta]MBB5436225.1 hypothetical protein [Nocardiopsis composta]
MVAPPAVRARPGAPADGATSWDFSALDEFVDDFLEATEGRPVVANLATIPTWMFETPEPVPYGDDPEEAQWGYEQGREFRDPTLAQVAEYFERVARWYLAGGFQDEYGRWHESGRRHRFSHWEVLCEPDVGHELSPETETHINEIGTFTPDLLNPDPRVPDGYWALSGAVGAYRWSHFAEIGIDLVGFAEFMAYPGMVPGVGLLDWETGAPTPATGRRSCSSTTSARVTPWWRRRRGRRRCPTAGCTGAASPPLTGAAPCSS